MQQVEKGSKRRDCNYCRNHPEDFNTPNGHLIPFRDHKGDCNYNNGAHIQTCKKCLCTKNKSENVKMSRINKRVSESNVPTSSGSKELIVFASIPNRPIPRQFEQRMVELVDESIEKDKSMRIKDYRMDRGSFRIVGADSYTYKKVIEKVKRWVAPFGNGTKLQASPDKPDNVVMSCVVDSIIDERQFLSSVRRLDGKEIFPGDLMDPSYWKYLHIWRSPGGFKIDFSVDLESFQSIKESEFKFVLNGKCIKAQLAGKDDGYSGKRKKRTFPCEENKSVKRAAK